MKIKVGDRVRFRSDLEVGKFYGDLAWSANNNRWLGKEVRIMRISNLNFGFFKIENYGGFLDMYNWFSEEMLEPVRYPEIHITTDGATVHAVLKQGGKVIKRSKAVCSPDDKFNFQTGAKIALGRLEEKQKPKFVPYLSCKVWKESEENYGTIGEPVAMTLMFGEPLYVGDVVECYSADTGYHGKGFVVKPTGEESFVMGLKGEFFKNGISSEWQIRKAKSYKDLKHGETYDNVTAALEDNHEN